MARGGRLDRVVWDQFGSDPERLHSTAQTIRAGAHSEEVRAELGAFEEQDETEFPEGRIVYRRHRARERNRALVEKKKRKSCGRRAAWRAPRVRSCSAAAHGVLGEGFIECHHAVALSELSEERRTRLEDVVLVCSNCHRMIHRRRPWLAAAQIKA